MTLISSIKKVTKDINTKVWKVYNTWCNSSARDPASLVSILEFLQDGADKGLAVSTVKIQFAALAVFLEKSVASDPLVIRFIKALTRSRTSTNQGFPEMGSIHSPTVPNKESF